MPSIGPGQLALATIPEGEPDDRPEPIPRREPWDAERARIARSLHDRVGQPMTSLLMEVNRARVEQSAPSATLDAIEALARDALQGARQAVLDIVEDPELRDPVGAAREYSESTLAISGCELVWEEMPDFRSLPVETARHVAAVIRESVTNVARHAAARTIYVKMARSGNRVIISVEDDGVGPGDLDTRNPKASFGLRANEDRARELGGSFEIGRRPEGGTVVRFYAEVGTEA